MIILCHFCKEKIGHSDTECGVPDGRHYCSYICKNAQRIQDEDAESAIVNEWAKRAELAAMPRVVVDVPLNDVFGSVSSFLEDEP